MPEQEVPDSNQAEIIALFAWDGKLVDVTDVVDTQREEFNEAALLDAHCYNNVEKRRSFYGVPVTGSVLPLHIWKSLVEKAGYKIEDIPKTWDACFDLFKGVQKKRRAQGVSNVYGIRLPARLWRRWHGYQGRPAVPRRSAGQGSGGQSQHLSDQRL